MTVAGVKSPMPIGSVCRLLIQGNLAINSVVLYALLISVLCRAKLSNTLVTGNDD